MSKILFSLTVVGLFFIGCNSKIDENDLEGNCMMGGSDAPNWVCGDISLDDKYTDVGIAKVTKLGVGQQRKMALADAKANLSQQLSTVVKDTINTLAADTGGVANSSYENISEQISNTALKNVRQLKMWQNPEDKSIYIIVGIDKKIVSDGIEVKYKEEVNAKENIDE